MNFYIIIIIYIQSFKYLQTNCPFFSSVCHCCSPPSYVVLGLIRDDYICCIGNGVCRSFKESYAIIKPIRSPDRMLLHRTCVCVCVFFFSSIIDKYINFVWCQEVRSIVKFSLSGTWVFYDIECDML